MTDFIFIHELVNPKTGKTYKQENMEMLHGIPIGTLVEVRYDRWHGDGCCEKVHARLWVVAHDRDCDGTPLYRLSKWRDPAFAIAVRETVSGFPEDMLQPIEVTEAIRQGVGALAWGEE